MRLFITIFISSLSSWWFCYKVNHLNCEGHFSDQNVRFMVIVRMWFKGLKHELKICQKKGLGLILEEAFKRFLFSLFVLDIALSTEIKYNCMQ